MKDAKSEMSKITFVRLCFSGSIAGIAIAGIVSNLLGIDAPTAKDLIGGVTGAGAVIAFKLAYF